MEEFKSIGSTIMYPGADRNPSNVHLTRSSSSNYDSALKNWDSNTH